MLSWRPCKVWMRTFYAFYICCLEFSPFLCSLVCFISLVVVQIMHMILALVLLSGPPWLLYVGVCVTQIMHMIQTLVPRPFTSMLVILGHGGEVKWRGLLYSLITGLAWTRANYTKCSGTHIIHSVFLIFTDIARIWANHTRCSDGMKPIIHCVFLSLLLTSLRD